MFKKSFIMIMVILVCTFMFSGIGFADNFYDPGTGHDVKEEVRDGETWLVCEICGEEFQEKDGIDPGIPCKRTIKYYAGDKELDSSTFNFDSFIRVLDFSEVFEDTSEAVKWKAWNTEPDGSGDTYKPNEEMMHVMSDVVLYAVPADKYKLNISYNIDNANALYTKDNITEAYEGQLVELWYDFDSNYDFVSVELTKDNETEDKVDVEWADALDSGGPFVWFTMPDCDVNIRASLEEREEIVDPDQYQDPEETTFTVSFMLDDGDIWPEFYTSQRVDKGECAIRPEDPVREGYVFDGWYWYPELTEIQDCIDPYNFDSPVKSHINIIGKWTKTEEPGDEVDPPEGNETDPGDGNTPDPDEGQTPGEGPEPVTPDNDADKNPTPSGEDPSEEVTPAPVEPTDDEKTPAAPEKQLISISKAKVSIKASYVYTGNKKTPSITVKLNGKKLKKGTDYTVKHSTRKAVGLATITIKGKGNYTGTKKVTFKIIPKKPTLSSLKPAKKAITVKWKKMPTKMTKKRITGYQIQYSLKKDFSSKKSIKVKGYKNTSYKIKNLKSKKRYYVRVRTYMKVGDKTYYSKWSKVKNVKTK